MPTLVFIDTNIFLDFYRVRGPESDLAILDHIDSNHNRIITSNQVEMEFKKNRPAVILGTYRDLKLAEWKGLAGLPAFLAKSRQSTALKTSRKRIESLLKTLRNRTKRILEDPTRNDSVYKVVQRLFRDDTACNLTRLKDARFRIRRLAAKRFILGYPPRKGNDTSIGDAVNWEWIVRCASDNGSDVVVVSRDSDFGVEFDGDAILNDWLRQEIRDRVSHRRSIILTNRLATGFKTAGIRVTKRQEEAEEEFLKERQHVRTLRVPVTNLSFAPDVNQSLAAIGRMLRVSNEEMNEAVQRLRIRPPTLPRDDEQDA